MCYTLILLLLLLFHDPVLQFLFLSGLFSFKKQKTFLILNASLKSYYSSRPDVAEIGVNLWWSNRFLSLKLLIYESCLRWVTVSFFPHDKGSLWNYAPLTVLFFKWMRCIEEIHLIMWRFRSKSCLFVLKSFLIFCFFRIIAA